MHAVSYSNVQFTMALETLHYLMYIFTESLGNWSSTAILINMLGLGFTPQLAGFVSHVYIIMFVCTTMLKLIGGALAT